MLIDSLYTITNRNFGDGNVQATLQLNRHHLIFNGHFPGQPVLPGACMLQIVKEVLEMALNHKIRLQRADQMKFLAMVDPNVQEIINLKITYTLQDEEIKTSATISFEDTTCFRLKGTFVRL